MEEGERERGRADPIHLPPAINLTTPSPYDSHQEKDQTVAMEIGCAPAIRWQFPPPTSYRISTGQKTCYRYYLEEEEKKNPVWSIWRSCVGKHGTDERRGVGGCSQRRTESDPSLTGGTRLQTHLLPLHLYSDVSAAPAPNSYPPPRLMEVQRLVPHTAMSTFNPGV